MSSSAVRTKQTRFDKYIVEIDKLIEKTGAAILESAGTSSTEDPQSGLTEREEVEQTIYLKRRSTKELSYHLALRGDEPSLKKLYTEVQEWCTKIKNNYSEKTPAEPRSKPRKFKPNTSTFCYNDWTHARTLRSAGSKRPNEGV